MNGIFDFIEEEKDKGEFILVHCRAGISRSSTVVIAYLMKYKQWSLKKAFIYTKLKRKSIFPNQSFFKELIVLENKLHNSNSLQIEELFEDGFPKWEN